MHRTPHRTDPDLESTGAVPPVACRARGWPRRRAAADIGCRRLSSAQYPSQGHLDHDQPSGNRLSAAVPHGDPEIPGFEGEPLDRRFAAQTAGNTLGTTPSLGRRAYQKGLLTFVWRAEDDNRDDLVYDVLYRREGDTTWKPLKQNLSEAIMVWDTTSVPNGRYILRVVASDTPSNSSATTLTGSLESTTFDIDNTPPAIVVTGSRRDGNRIVLTFDVRDEDSAVQRVEYSIDGTGGK